MPKVRYSTADSIETWLVNCTEEEFRELVKKLKIKGKFNE